MKSEFATLSIPEYELTLPPGKGQLTTVESIIRATIQDLEFEQPARQHLQPSTYEKIEIVLTRLRPIITENSETQTALEKSFTLKIEDPSGNSFIEAKGGFEDPKWSKREFRRTPAQNDELGLASSVSAAAPAAKAAIALASASAANAVATKTLTDDYQESKPEEIYSFPDVCSSCGATLETFMKTVDIPHFKEVVLMSTNCHSCGYRDNEIKSGGAIADQGRRIILKVEDSEDLSRDILKVSVFSADCRQFLMHL